MQMFDWGSSDWPKWSVVANDRSHWEPSKAGTHLHRCGKLIAVLPSQQPSTFSVLHNHHPTIIKEHRVPSFLSLQGSTHPCQSPFYPLRPGLQRLPPHWPPDMRSLRPSLQGLHVLPCTLCLLHQIGGVSHYGGKWFCSDRFGLVPKQFR